MSNPYFDNNGGTFLATVELQHTADVFLTNEQNYQRYIAGESFSYIGGNYNTSPVKIRISEPGRWYLIVDSGSDEFYQYHWSKP